MAIEILTEEKAILGESPLWHQAEQALFWVDIHGDKVFRYDPDTGENEVVFDGEQVTAACEMDTGGLLLVTSHALIHLADGATTELADLRLRDGVRTNDGKCGPDGRLWFGTMDLDVRSPIAELFCFDGDRFWTAQRDVILSNGIGWSPDGEVFYHVDSIRRLLFSYSYEKSGEISDRAVLVDMTGHEEVPDGIAVDAEGNIWVAMYDGWRVDVYDPAGERLDVVRLGAQKPTSVAFGGVDLEDMYVTTASENLNAEELRDQPQAGELLRLTPGVAGLPVGPFSPR